jgi:hypothetical protein
MNTKIVSNLPVPGSGCGDIRFCFDNADVLLEFEFHNNGRDWIGGIHFGWDTAFRFRDEYRSLGFTDASYDALVEILNSEWITELKKNRISRENGFGDRSVISPFFFEQQRIF